MSSDRPGLFRALLPPGSVRFILSIVCSVISLVSAFALAILVFGQQINSDLLSKLVVMMFIVGVLIVVHPNVKLTRGAKWPLTYMSALLLLCISLTSITLLWSYFRGLDNIYSGGLLGLVSGALGLLGYRSRALENLRAHFYQIWQDEYRRREYLRKGK